MPTCRIALSNLTTTYAGLTNLQARYSMHSMQIGWKSNLVKITLQLAGYWLKNQRSYIDSRQTYSLGLLDSPVSKVSKSELRRSQTRLAAVVKFRIEIDYFPVQKNNFDFLCLQKQKSGATIILTAWVAS